MVPTLTHPIIVLLVLGVGISAGSKGTVESDQLASVKHYDALDRDQVRRSDWICINSIFMSPLVMPYRDIHTTTPSPAHLPLPCLLLG